MIALPVRHITEVSENAEDTRWLVDRLWSHQAVGIIGGAPKNCKSWFALDLAVSVASATPALGRFAVDDPGRAIVYLAEDALPVVRQRIAGIACHRGLALAELDLHVITAPALRLDLAEDQQALAAMVETHRPRLLILDPLVRLHRLDENSSADISALLGFLRQLQREFGVAIMLVHHTSERVGAHLGQALRGSGDLHAWGDSNAYLVRRRDRLVLELEHRAAAAPDPMALRLVADASGAHLEVEGGAPDGDVARKPPLARRIVRALAELDQPQSRTALRGHLRVNNSRLGDALTTLEAGGRLVRTPKGWALAPEAVDRPARAGLG